MVVRAKLQIITQSAKTNCHKSQTSSHSTKKLAAGALSHAQLRPVLLFKLAVQAVSYVLFFYGHNEAQAYVSGVATIKH